MNTTKEQKTFFGAPIVGDIQYHHRSERKQKTAEEFHEALTKVLSDPRIASVRWTQYTPYFNDGDPCEFSVNEAYFRVEGADPLTEDDENYDEDYDEWNGYEGGGGWYQPFGYSYAGRTNLEDIFGTKEGYHYDNSYKVDNPGNPELIALMEEFLSDFNSGAYENVLLSFFGDHADITATKDKFVVEFVEHD